MVKIPIIPRIYFLDNLKVFLAFLVVLNHAAQPYGPGGAWVIPSETGSYLGYLVLGIFLGVISSFFMGLFFMISAYFVPSSLERKGADKFMKDRLVRLGVPILIFTFGVYPILSYLVLHMTQPLITVGNLWFLVLLLLFTAVYVAYWLVKRPSSKSKRDFPGNAAILAFIIILALISFVVSIWAPINYWVPFGLFEPFHLTQYIMLFVVGILVYREGWIDAIPKFTANLWTCVAILMVILLPVIAIATNKTLFSGGLTLSSLIGSFWVAFMCVSMCIALLSLFKNRFNSQGTFAKALANNSYTVFIIQIPIIVFLQSLLIGVPIDPFFKFIIVGAIGIPLIFAISHYIIRRLPYAKYVLG